LQFEKKSIIFPGRSAGAAGDDNVESILNAPELDLIGILHVIPSFAYW